MARRRNTRRQDETIIDIVEAKEQAAGFFERNQYLIIGVLSLAVILVGGYLAYSFLYKAPREQRAMEQIYRAELQFKQDSFALALENPGGGYDGFLDIIDNYGGTKTSNLAHYYAGISYLNIGMFDVAIDYLKDFKASGDVAPITKFGAMGDAYSELNDFNNAIKNYEKATKVKSNELLTPYYLKKLGLLHEIQGNQKAALAAFKRIKSEFESSAEAQTVDMDIVRTEN